MRFRVIFTLLDLENYNPIDISIHGHSLCSKTPEYRISMYISNYHSVATWKQWWKSWCIIDWLIDLLTHFIICVFIYLCNYLVMHVFIYACIYGFICQKTFSSPNVIDAHLIRFNICFHSFIIFCLFFFVAFFAFTVFKCPRKLNKIWHFLKRSMCLMLRGCKWFLVQNSMYFWLLDVSQW